MSDKTSYNPEKKPVKLERGLYSYRQVYRIRRLHTRKWEITREGKDFKTSARSHAEALELIDERFSTGVEPPPFPELVRRNGEVTPEAKKYILWHVETKPRRESVEEMVHHLHVVSQELNLSLKTVLKIADGKL